MNNPQIEAVYKTASIAVRIKNFDPVNPIHIKIQAMLEEEFFEPGVMRNIWERKSFADWDNFQFWTKEVQKLAAKYPNISQPETVTPVEPAQDEPINIERIGEKIKRLLALSQSQNEAEAIAAFAKAQEMLTRHNLSMADLADEKPELVEEVIIDQWSHRCTWKEILFGAVAEANYCYALYSKSIQGIKPILLGRPSNIKSAELQFNYLVEAVDRLARLANSDRAFKNSFRLGAAQRLQSRIIEGMKKQKEEGIVGNSEQASVSAIVVRSLYEKLDAELEAYIAQNLKVKTARTKPSLSSVDGYVAGVEAGDRVSLNKQVTGKTQRYLP